MPTFRTREEAIALHKELEKKHKAIEAKLRREYKLAMLGNSAYEKIGYRYT